MSMASTQQPSANLSVSLPDGWQVKRLEEIAKIERGKFMHRPRNEPRFFGGSVPFIQTGDVANSGGRITRHSQTLNELGLSISRLFPKGTIVITIAANIGDTAILDYDCAFPDSLIGITPFDQSDPAFLEFYLRTQKDEMNRLAPRGTQKNINIQFLQPWPVVLPPLEEQRAIAHVLRSVQQAKEATEKVIAAARQLKQSLMRHLFTYGPVPLGQADRVPLKDTEIGSVPEHWQVVSFEQAVAFASGQVDPRELPYSKMRHVGPENIEEATGRLLPLQIAEDLKLISGKYLFDSNDVLYSKIRPYLRKVALPTFQGICSADMYPLRPQDKTILREFLYVWLLSDRFTAQAISFQDRTGIPKINRKQLQSTRLPLPPTDEQVAIARSILGCDRKAEAEEARKEAVDALSQTLLHNLMTGKVRVHDVPAFAKA